MQFFIGKKVATISFVVASAVLCAPLVALAQDTAPQPQQSFLGFIVQNIFLSPLSFAAPSLEAASAMRAVLAQEGGEQSGPEPEAQPMQNEEPTQPAPVDSSFGGNTEVGGGGGGSGSTGDPTSVPISFFDPPALKTFGWGGGPLQPETSEPIKYEVTESRYTEQGGQEYTPLNQAQKPQQQGPEPEQQIGANGVAQNGPVDPSFGGNAEVAVGGGFSLFKKPQQETPELGQEPVQYKTQDTAYKELDYMPLNQAQAPAPKQQDSLNAQNVLATSKFLDANGVSPEEQKTILGGLYDFVTGADTKDGPMVSNSGCKTPDGSSCTLESKYLGGSRPQLGNDYDTGIRALPNVYVNTAPFTFAYVEKGGVGYWYSLGYNSEPEGIAKGVAALKEEGYENIRGVVLTAGGAETKEVNLMPAGGLQQIETYTVPGATADKLAPTLPPGFDPNTSLEEGKKDLISRSADAVFVDNKWYPSPVDLNERKALIEQLQAKGDVTEIRSGGIYEFKSQPGGAPSGPQGNENPSPNTGPRNEVPPGLGPRAVAGLETTVGLPGSKLPPFNLTPGSNVLPTFSNPTPNKPYDPLYGTDNIVPAGAKMPVVGGGTGSNTPGSAVTGGGSAGVESSYYVNLKGEGTGLVTLREGQAPPAGYTRVWSTGDGGFTPTAPTREGGQSFAETALVNRIQASANAPVPVEPPGFFERAWNFITGRSSSAPAPTSQTPYSSVDDLLRTDRPATPAATTPTSANNFTIDPATGRVTAVDPITGRTSAVDVPVSRSATSPAPATESPSFWSDPIGYLSSKGIIGPPPKVLQAPPPQKQPEGFLIGGGIRIR
ncbi:MAG: hypothetical protein NT019_01895 [Candidatus Adlerbacteria bacterium]|nr:hypothetical protein [Candidatus Adlerbacteria bacterium]